MKKETIVMPVNQRLDFLESRVGALETEFEHHARDAVQKQEMLLKLLEQNMTLTQQMATDTKEMHDVWVQGKAAFTTFNFLFTWARKATLTVLFVVLFIFSVPYVFSHNGALPPFLKEILTRLLS